MYEKIGYKVRTNYHLLGRRIVALMFVVCTFCFTFLCLPKNVYAARNGSKITSVSAVYVGEAVMQGCTYNKDNVVVTVKYANGKSKVLKSNEWQDDGFKTILWSGENFYNGSYKSISFKFIVYGCLVPETVPVDYIVLPDGSKLYNNNILESPCTNPNLGPEVVILTDDMAERIRSGEPYCLLSTPPLESDVCDIGDPCPPTLE